MSFLRDTPEDCHPIFLKMYHYMFHFMSSLVTWDVVILVLLVLKTHVWLQDFYRESNMCSIKIGWIFSLESAKTLQSWIFTKSKLKLQNHTDIIVMYFKSYREIPADSDEINWNCWKINTIHGFPVRFICETQIICTVLHTDFGLMVS